MKKLNVLLLLLLPAFSYAGDHVVDQANEKFDTPSLAMKSGETVTFKNSDSVTHNLTVVFPDETTKDMGTEGPGKNISFKATTPGTYDVRCSVHPRMKMKLKVE